MRSNPPKDLYDPDYAVEAVRVVAEKAHPVFREVINKGAEVFEECERNTDRCGTTYAPDTHLAVLSAFHNLLEALDAANEMLVVGRAAGSHSALRSALEAVLAIEYILEDEASYKQRAFAYLLAAQRAKIKIWRQQVSGTPERKEYVEAIRKDKYMSGAIPKSPSGARVAVKRQEGLLLKAGWIEAEMERKRCKAEDGRAPEWHRLHGGPKTLLDLAICVGRPFQYEVLYRSWSRTTHAQDLGRILGGKDGRPTYSMIPDIRGIQQDFSFGMSFGLGASRVVLRFFRGDEASYSRWYTDEIAPVFLALSKGTLGVS